MAAIDQPTPPNYGNLTQAQFLLLPDWSVTATNQTGPDGEELPDTFTAMDLCIVALFYRLVRDNFAYLNEAWACRVSTPILDKIEELQTQLQTRPTDNLGQGLTISLLNTFAIEVPDLLFSCNGTNIDEVSATIALVNVDGPATPHPVYHVVNAVGGPATPGPVVYGLRTTLNRYYYTDANIANFQSSEFIVSCNVTLQWPQDSSAGSKIVLLKVADYLTTTETGVTKRMQFELGLQDAGTGFDAAAHGTDRVLYLRYFDASDVEVKTTALVSGEAVGIGLGREITIACARLNQGGPFGVTFYVNGVKINTVSGLATPSAGTSTDIRLHVGANQLGTDWVGGPVNNVYYDGAPDASQSVADARVQGIYRIGAGYLTT